ncbi:hypothetical protein LIER_35585 [Lithospermum erythrorhizon]|uniref:Uncharacterized protein n=1 Tax=Lithospermum erythrorhizon TaxID=34254 RepID=A0AAV3NWY4_LITER
MVAVLVSGDGFGSAVENSEDPIGLGLGLVFSGGKEGLGGGGVVVLWCRRFLIRKVILFFFIKRVKEIDGSVSVFFYIWKCCDSRVIDVGNQ